VSIDSEIVDRRRRPPLAGAGELPPESLLIQDTLTPEPRRSTFADAFRQRSGRDVEEFSTPKSPRCAIPVGTVMSRISRGSCSTDYHLRPVNV
jgi:hypothetical protein